MREKMSNDKWGRMKRQTEEERVVCLGGQKRPRDGEISLRLKRGQYGKI